MFNKQVRIFIVFILIVVPILLIGDTVKKLIEHHNQLNKEVIELTNDVNQMKTMLTLYENNIIKLNEKVFTRQELNCSSTEWRSTHPDFNC